MSTLKDAVRALHAAKPVTLRLSEIPLVVRTAERIDTSEATSDVRKSDMNYDVIARNLLSCFERDGTLSAREAREAAWCLWETKPALSEREQVVRCILDATETSRRKQPFRALASSYMKSFEPDRPAIEAISRVLSRLAPSMGEPWAPLQQKLQLFHLINGTTNLGREAIARRTSPTSVLSAFGLGAINAQSGFARNSIAAALSQIRDGAEARPDERLELVKTFALGEGRLLFDEQGPLVADALLFPFGQRVPSESVIDSYLEVLLRLFGDPRIHPARWTRMQQAAAIVRKWLTRQSLRQFFDVVDTVALERMWKYRRAFWDAVYMEELISDAWVVFCPAGATAARKAFGKEISFATFNGTVLTGQAVLLLRIGRGVVAEWSHSGKCVIWNDAEKQNAPKLHAARYSPHSLRAPANADASLDRSDFAISHHSPDNYHWQMRVAEKLYQMTNVRISQKQYRVK